MQDKKQGFYALPESEQKRLLEQLEQNRVKAEKLDAFMVKFSPVIAGGKFNQDEFIKWLNGGYDGK